MEHRVKTIDSEWYNKWQRMTASGSTNDSDWQQITTSDSECQGVVQQIKTNESQWEQAL